MFYVLEDARDWIVWKLSFLTPWLAGIHSLILAIVGFVHRLSGSILSHEVEWDLVWTSVPVCADVTVVVRVTTTFGVNTKVEGFLALYHRCGIYRVLVDGHEVVHNDDGIPTKGDIFYGSFYLPESVTWKLDTRKVKSVNTSSIRGRCAVLTFDRNPTGITQLQITVLRNNPSTYAKKAAAEFEKAIINAKLHNSSANM